MASCVRSGSRRRRAMMLDGLVARLENYARKVPAVAPSGAFAVQEPPAKGAWKGSFCRP